MRFLKQSEGESATDIEAVIDGSVFRSTQKIIMLIKTETFASEFAVIITDFDSKRK